MSFSRLSLWSLPIVVLSALGLSTIRPPQVEPGLQVAKSGVVLDAQTHQPLAGVYVVTRWLEQTTSNSLGASARTEGQCLFRTVTRTDEQGRYEVPASSFPISADRTFAERRYYWDTYAYSPGFAVAPAMTLHPHARGSTIPGVQVLVPMLLAADHAAPQQRVATLADTLARFTCQPYSRESAPVAREVYAEAYAAACLPEPNAAAGLLTLLRGEKSNAGSGISAPCAQLQQASNSP